MKMRWLLALVVLASCMSQPTPTGTVCPMPDPDTLTYDNFGMDFMTRYCISCHDSHLPYSMRNGAPLYHDFDTLEGVMEVPDHIDEYAGVGPKADNSLMPPDRCPSVAGGPLDSNCAKPTTEERRNLSMWIACEKSRPHTF